MINNLCFHARLTLSFAEPIFRARGSFLTALRKRVSVGDDEDMV